MIRLFHYLVFLPIPHHQVDRLLKAPVEAIEAFVLVRRSRTLVHFIMKDRFSHRLPRLEALVIDFLLQEFEDLLALGFCAVVASTVIISEVTRLINFYNKRKRSAYTLNQ